MPSSSRLRSLPFLGGGRAARRPRTSGRRRLVGKAERCFFKPGDRAAQHRRGKPENHSAGQGLHPPTSAWLQLEVAQLALMRRDQQAFRTALQRVKQSLSKWFDTGDSKYQAAMRNLDDLAGLEIQVQVPDITAPWSTLRMLRSAPPPRPPQLRPQPRSQPQSQIQPRHPKQKSKHRRPGLTEEGGTG